ncbi:Conserved_hypothetical protein [Hexamita inflata]|uniref:Uncharacterized protein n=1 Tax=Hexamita inflata TaxID=28002 RepID=A0ABP1HB07_9EUKA
MEELVAVMKQNQMDRENQFVHDMQLLRSEGVMYKCRAEELQRKLELSQNEQAQTKLELSTALAAAQIRVEQLQNLYNDQRYEVKELKQETQKQRIQLDACRDEYLTLQRHASTLQEDYNKLKQEHVSLKLNQQQQLTTFKQAVIGASSVLNQDVSFNAVIDTLVDAQNYKGSQLDFVLAKVARLSKEVELLQSKNESLTKEKELMQSKIKRCEQQIIKSGQMIQNPSVQLIYDELEHKEKCIVECENIINDKDKQLKAAETRIKETEEINQKMMNKMKEQRRKLQEVDELRKIVKGLIEQ